MKPKRRKRQTRGLDKGRAPLLPRVYRRSVALTLDQITMLEQYGEGTVAKGLRRVLDELAPQIELITGVRRQVDDEARYPFFDSDSIPEHDDEGLTPDGDALRTMKIR